MPQIAIQIYKGTNKEIHQPQEMKKRMCGEKGQI